jgi:hypothetical protein
MGSAFPAEPPEWFACETGPLLMFSFVDPNLLMHHPTRRCKIEYPHRVEECGEMEVDDAIREVT